MKVLIPTLIVVVILIIGALVWFLRSRKNHAKQDFLVITGVRDIVNRKIQVVEAGRYAADERNAEAWAISEVRQRYDRESKNMVQIVCGWNCNPLDLTGQNSGDIDKGYISALASRITAESKLGFERKKQRNTVVLWVGIIGVILAVAISVPLFQGIGNGSIRVPNPSSIITDIGNDLGR